MRLLEYLLIFFGLVGLYIAVHVPGGPIPVLLLAAIAVVGYLRRTRTPLVRAGVPTLWAAVSALAVVAVALIRIRSRGTALLKPCAA